jgi:8-oxo-dGTP diphosphatase
MRCQNVDEPRVGVGVVIRRGADILLIRRKNVHGAGTWSTPGGHLEAGETPDRCAAREAREETGVEVENVRFLGVTNDVFEAEGRHYVTLWMEADYLSGTAAVRAAHEMSEVRWCPSEALPANLFLSLRNLVDGRSYGVEATGLTPRLLFGGNSCGRSASWHDASRVDNRPR